MDLVTRTPRIPAIGQTLIGTGFETTPGGKGANQAVAAARLGYRVAMVAKVGDDVFGPALLENLKHAGVDTAAMAQTAGSSGLAPMFVADDGRERHCCGSGRERQDGSRNGRQPCGPDSLGRHGSLPA